MYWIDVILCPNKVLF